MEHVPGLIILAFLAPFYFIPSAFAFRKAQFWSVLIINLLFGWTFIGWIVALIWGVYGSKPPRDDAALYPPPVPLLPPPATPPQGQQKICPQCQAHCPIRAAYCSACGHQFRTQFP